MATQSYLSVSGGINVDVIKIDTNLSYSFDEAKLNMDEMLNTTILHNDFEETIDARYFSPEGPTTGANYTVYRKTPEQQYYDYNIENGNYYHYLCSIETFTSGGPDYIIYENKDEEGNLNYIKTQWDEWSICDIEDTDEENIYFKTGSTWNFKCNLSEEVLNQNNSITVWDTLGIYPKISIGEKNYDGSTFSCLLGDVTEYNVYNQDGVSKQKYGYTELINKNYRYSRDTEKIIAWRKFCNNGKIKLLKDIKGNAWIVQITDTPTRTINNTTNELYTTISFNWIEIEDKNNISIIKLGEIRNKSEET